MIPCMTWVRSHWKICLVVLFINLIVLAGCIHGYHDDYYTLNLDLNRYSEEVPTEDQSKIDPDDFGSLSLSGDEEAILSSAAYRIPAGYYYMYAEYETERECSLESYSKSYVNQDNSLGNTFGGMALSPDRTTAEGPIWLDRDATDMNVLLHYNGGNITIYKIRIQSMNSYSDMLVIYILFLLLEFITGMMYFRHNTGGRMAQMGIWSYLLFVALVATVPLMNDSVLSGDDLSFHIDRIKGISDWITNISWQRPLERINEVSANGGGYAAPIFYPQLLLLIPGVLYTLGTSMLISYKIYVFIVNFLTAGIAYWSFSRLSGKKFVGIAGATLYTFSLYRLIDVYRRAAVGEFTAMAFLPLLFWALYEVFFRKEKNWKYLALAMTGILQSHILTTAMCIYYALIFGVCGLKSVIKRPQRILSLLKATGVTVLINLWFIVPFVQCSSLPLRIFVDPDETRDINATGAFPSQSFYISNFGNGGEAPIGITGRITFSSGTLLILLSVLFLAYMAVLKHKITEDHKRQIAIFLLCGFLSLIVSSFLFPWEFAETLPITANVQFAWRYYGFASVFLSYIGALCVSIPYVIFNQKWGKEEHYGILFMTAIAVVFFLALNEIHPYMDSLITGSGYNKEQMEMAGEPDALYSYDNTEYSFDNLYVPDNWDVHVRSFEQNGTEYTIEMNVLKSDQDSALELPVNYFPGYHLEMNGNEIAFWQSEDKKIAFQVPEGEQALHLYFEEWKRWKIADAISAISVLLLVLHVIKKEMGGDISAGETTIS